MIRRSIHLPLSPERAFKLFTERAGEWWPEGRRHTSDPGSQILIEPGGRFVERARSGHEVPMGRVLEWAPPSRLLLAFYPGTGPEMPTEVTVRFVAVQGGTELVIEHRPTAASAAISVTGSAVSVSSRLASSKRRVRR